MKRHQSRSCRIAACLVGTCLATPILAQEDIGEVVISHNYSDQLNAEALQVPEHDRAWPIYRDAIMTATTMDEDLRYGSTGPYWPAPVGEPGWDECRAYVQENQKAIALIHLAATKPHLGYIISDAPDQILARRWAELSNTEFKPKTPSENPPLYNILLPQLGETRRISRLIRQDLRIAIEEADAKRVMADIKTMNTIAYHVRQPPIMINELVGLSIDHQWRDELLLLLHNHPNLLDREQLTTLRDLVRATNHPSDMHETFDVERLLFLDAIQRCYTLNNDANGYLTPAGYQLASVAMHEPLNELDVKDFAGAMAARAAGATREFESQSYVNYLAPWHAKLDDPRPWDADYWKDAIDQVKTLNTAKAKLQHPITSQYVAALDKAVTSTMRAQLQQSTLDLVLALELHKRETGAYPAALNDLVPEYLDAIPTDPLDGNPVRYKLANNNPLLYSVGANRADENALQTPDTTYNQHAAYLNPINIGRNRARANAEPMPLGDWILYPIKR